MVVYLWWLLRNFSKVTNIVTLDSKIGNELIFQKFEARGSKPWWCYPNKIPQKSDSYSICNVKWIGITLQCSYLQCEVNLQCKVTIELTFEQKNQILYCTPGKMTQMSELQGLYQIFAVEWVENWLWRVNWRICTFATIKSVKFLVHTAPLNLRCK